MRGKYDVSNTPYIRQLWSEMTLTERVWLKTLPFKKLWLELWNNDLSRDRVNEKLTSKHKFESLDKASIHDSIPVAYQTPEWGFPKGRKKYAEADLECAIREFYEETNITNQQYTLLDIPPLEECFMGSNGIYYRHIYFLAKPNIPNLTLQVITKQQQDEIGDIHWVNINSAIHYIRPYQIHRLALIERLKTVIDTNPTAFS
jgi:8-oxo-dGTP pyrophosphatase MutT (NUDIX family)